MSDCVNANIRSGVDQPDIRYVVLSALSVLICQ